MNSNDIITHVFVWLQKLSLIAYVMLYAICSNIVHIIINSNHTLHMVIIEIVLYEYIY